MLQRSKHLERGRLAAAAVGLVALAAAMPASAADNVSVTVNATVIGVCKFFNTSPAPVLNITNTSTGSNIDPSLTGDAIGSTTVTYRCSNGTAPTFNVASTSVPVTCSACSGTPSMTATINLTSGGPGSGMGIDKTLTVAGTITQATFVNAAAGAYTGSVTVSVTP